MLDGGRGADYMAGSSGNDTYVVDNAGDSISEYPNSELFDEGYDTVLSSISYVLPEAVEELRLTGSAALNGTGNAESNQIYGNAGANILDGGSGGVNWLYGGRGNDTYIIRSFDDHAREHAGEGIDTIKSYRSYWLIDAMENLTLLGSDNLIGVGNYEKNTIIGNDGGNYVDGLGGADILTGGQGGDRFAFSTALGNGNVDRITDFTVGEDKLLLANSLFGLAAGTASLSADQFTSGSKATSTDHRIVYNSASGMLLYDADGTGTAAAVAFAVLGRNLSLSASSFEIFTPG